MSRFSWMRWLRSYTRPQQATFRKRSRVRWRPALELLEDRLAPATLPTALVSNAASIQVPTAGGRLTPLAGFSPDVVEDPTNNQNVVAVYATTTGLLGMSFSTDGGQNWTGFLNTSATNFKNISDPLANASPNATPQVLFAEVTNPTAAWDRSGNVYVTEIQRNAADTSGALVFQRFQFTAGGLTQTIANKVLKWWDVNDPVFNPVVSVDNNVSSFTDTTAPANNAQADTLAGREVFVAWNTNNTAPATVPNHFSANLIMAAGSFDNGANFTAPQIVSDGGNTPNVGSSNQVPTDADPQIVYTQGSADGRVAGGQLVFVWNDYANNTVVLDSSQPDGGRSSNISAGSFQFGGTTGTILDGGTRVNAAAVVTGGTGYSLGDILTVTNNAPGVVAPPVASNNAQLKVSALGATGPVTISSGGTGYKAGDTLTFVGGTGTATTITVGTVDANGVILTASIASAGSYTVLPPNPNNVSGGAGSGASIGVTFSVVTAVTVSNPGSYIVPPTNPVKVTGGGGTGATFTLTFGAPTPDLPTSTTFTDSVVIPANFTVNDLSVTLDVSHASINELDVQLVSPTGVTIQLFRNHTNGLGQVVDGNGNPIPPSTNPPAGITGSNLGELNGFLLGTVFDDNAPRSITDATFSAPYIGTFTPEVGNLDVAGIVGQAGNSANITGTWSLVVTDHKNEGETTVAAEPVQKVDGWTLNFSHVSTTGFGSDKTVPLPRNRTAATAVVAGAMDEPYAQANTGPFGAQGVGPGISVAVDNTLGAFSLNQGRVYIAYTGVGGGGTDTNVYLVSADDLRPSQAPAWNAPVQVNDDSVTDGFSQGNRPQFLPTVAVDQSTGTVGVMYYDGRWDPSVYSSQSRAGNSFSDSLDGGQTWSTSTFLNTPKTATDAITEQNLTLEPVPGNQAAAANAFGFGDRQGLVMAGGQVIPVFSSNDNIAGSFLKSATVTIAAGPRVVFGDMGPLVNDSTFTTGQGQTFTYNNSFAADGTRQLGGFVVEFDRPIVVSSFTPDQVTIEYHDTTTPAALPGVNITGFSVNPLDTGGPFGLMPQTSADLVATSFLILLDTPRSAVGTYSYAIGNLTGGPAINDGIKRTDSTTVGNFVDENQNAITGETPTATGPGDVFSVPTPTASGPFQLPYDSTTLPLIIPGPHPSLSTSLNNGTSVAFNPQWNSSSTDNTVLNGTNNGIDVTFDRAIQPSTFTPANVVRVTGPLGPITTYTLGPAVTFTGGGGTGAQGFATIVGGILTGVVITNKGSGYNSLPTVVFNGGGGSGATGTATIAGGQVTGVTLNTGGTGYTGTSAGSAALGIPDSGTLSVPLKISDSLQINDLGVGISLNDTHVSDLTATLTAPDGTVVELFDGGAGSNYTNTLFDAEAPDSVVAAAAPYTGIFRPAQGATAATGGGGGTGYKLNDVLVVQGGTFGVPAELQVTSVTNGAVTGVKLLRAGSYSVLPTNPVSVSDLTTPAGSGALFTLAFSSTLAALDGKNYQGTWTLRITDNLADGSSGHLTALALNPVVVTPDPQTLATAAVDSGGSGYKAGDHLIVQGGTYTAPAVLLVTSVDANGAVTGIAPLGIVLPLDAGLYSTAPAGPAGVAGGSGSGATFDLTFNSDGPAGQTFRVTFPTQTLNGSYTLQLGQDSAGNYILDTSLNSATVATGGSGYNVFDLLDVVGGVGTAAQFQVDAVGAETGPVPSFDIFGGGGYKVGDTLTVSGGTFLRPATLQVTSIGGFGAVTGATVINGGSYSAPPGGFVSVTGGSGTNAFFFLSFDALAVAELVDPGSYTTNPASPAPVNDEFNPGAAGATLNLTIGNRVDTEYHAGVPLLVGTVQTGGALITTSYASGTVNTPLPPGATVNVPITVPDSYLVQGVTVQLSILHKNDPDLSATLIAPDGSSDLLFSGAGATGSVPHANFTNTTLDDSATIPIGLAATQPVTGIGAGPYDPQLPLTTAFQGAGSLGTWVLQIHSDSSTLSGTLVKWGLTLKSAVNGLGEAVADQFAAPFRIFTQAPTDAVSQQSWTAVGPASINNGGASGRIGGLAVDPSDPSGNTVYTAGASGSVWKTTDFLTTNANGPTWVPLTDVGPSNSLNTGSIAVFGRNSNPNQSIVFVATGEGSTGTPGVGLLRSMDGGRTWQLLDSSDNVDASGNVLSINDPGRDHKFVGTSSFKVAVDPTLSPAGQVIVYVANSSGVWRSNDTGGHWTLLQAGDASDLALSAGSAGSTGNLQILYAAIEGAGVYFTSNAPTTASMILRGGNNGNPIRRDVDVTPDTAIPVSNDNVNPLQGGTGRITLATPALTTNPLENTLYEGWCYAVVANGGAFGGLYVTKDFGLNWTLVRLPVLNPFKPNETSTNNNLAGADDSVTGSAQFPQAEYNVSLTVDPNNANVVYIGGTADANPQLNTLYGGFIRVDISGLQDPYAVYAYDNSLNDGGNVQFATAGGVTIKAGGRSAATGALLGPGQPYGMINPDDPNTLIVPLAPYTDMLRDPENPFLTPASLQFTNIANFTNTGLGARYNSFTGGAQVAGSNVDPEAAPAGPGLGGTDQHQLLAFKDPLTGQTRLIFGDDQGIWTGTDNGTGNPIDSVGSAVEVGGSRNGNLQITQFYDGATQPSTLAASIAQAEFYGVAQDDGFPTSGPSVLDTGNLDWNGGGGDGSGVKVDQTGSGTAFYYKWPCCGGSNPLATDFWSVVYPVNSEVSRTTGLIQAGDNPGFPTTGQWPYLGGSKFAVNPIDGTSIVMSALKSGRIFLTSGPSLGQGVQWFPIGEPGQLDASYAEALAFGAPANAFAPLSDFIYAGTTKGNIFVTTTGGAPWKNISTGLDGSAVEQIVTNPTRGSNEAYAVTQNGVYWMPDSSVAAPQWTKITGNLFQLPRQLFNDPNQVLNPTAAGQQLKTLASLTAIQADWRYAIPGPNGPHPVLYVAGTGGVFRSLDQGKTWTFFPDISIDGAQTEGGQFPSMGLGEGPPLFGEGVTDLSLSMGNINPLNGTPDQPFGRNMLVATTYGRGTFDIRLNDSIKVNGVPLYTYAVNPVDGPHVATVSPVPDGDGVSLDGIQVTFSGPVDPATFTLADVLGVTDPFGNPVPVQSVADVTGGNPHNVYQITFVTPTTQLGFYHLSLGPNISDYSGYKLDQNQNGVNGEVPGDVYLGRFLFQPQTNTAPVLNATSALLSSLNEDVTAANDPGQSLVSFLAGLTPSPGITDADNASYAPLTAPVGVAITAVDDSNGTWQYSQDGGTTWANIPAGVADSSALVLEADPYGPNNWLRFLPNADFSGTSTFTFRAWDLTDGLSQPYGADGGLADASNPGGTSAFSDTSATTTITVNFVNDQPTFTAKNPPAVNEDGGAQTVTGWVTNFNASGDVGGPDANEAGQSVLQYIVSNVSNPALFSVLPAVDTSGNLTYTLNPDIDGTTTFDVQVQDSGGTANGGIDTSVAQTFTLTVNFVNDQPTFTAANPPAVNEDSGSQTVSPWVTNFNASGDAGGPDANEAGQNVLQYIVSNVTNPALFSVLPAVDNSGNLTYTLNPNVNGMSNFDVQVQDDGGTANGGIDTSAAQTFTLTVNFVNDQPSFTASNPPAINEDVTAPQTVNPWVTNFNPGGAPDPNEAGQSVLRYIVNNVTNSGLYAALPAVSNSGVLTYTLNADVAGTSNFDVQVQDSGGTANGGIDTSAAKTFTLTVNFVNDQPTFTASNPPTVNEDSGTQTVTGWVTSFNPGGAPDPNEQGQTVKRYIVTNVTNAGLFSALPTVSTTGTLTYTLKPNVNGSTNFNVQVQDSGGTLNGGIDTSAAQTFSLTVNFVNDQPTFTAANPPAINEDTTAPQTVNPWVTNFNPGGAPDANEQGQTVLRYIVTNVTNSGLYAVLPAVSNSGVLTYTLNADVAGSSSFNVQVQDSGGTLNGGVDTSAAKTFTLTVNFVNDQPSFTASNPPAINEDVTAPQTVTGWVTSFNPGGAPDANEAGQAVKRYIVSNITNPSLFAVQPAVSNSGVLTYTLNADAAGSSNFDVQVQDNGGTLNGGIDTSAAQTFALTVNFVNDQPTFTAANPPTVNEDAGSQTVTGWVTNFNPGGAPDPNEKGQTVLQYIVANVTNPALFSVLPAVDTSGNLTYTLNPDVNGTSKFDVQVQDNGGTDNGGVDTSAAQTFTLTVNFVNDQPTFTASNPPAANEDGGAQTVSGWATFNASGDAGGPDANEAGQAVKAYTVSNVTNPGLFSVLPAVDTSGNLTYTLKPDLAGASNFTVKVQDNGGTLNGGIDTSAAQTFTLTVNFVNDQPTFTASNPPTINEDVTTPQTVNRWVTNFNPGGAPDPNEQGQTVLRYIVTNVSNPGFFAVQPAVSNSGVLTYTLNPNVSGPVTFNVQVQDNGGTDNGGVDTSAAQTFTLTVNFVNDQPTFTASNPPAANEDGGAQTVSGWATFNASGDAGGPDANEAGQAVKAYTVSNVTNPGLFSVLPAVDTSGNLTYTLKPDLAGASSFSVKVQDNGGTANGGIDTSAAQTFTLAVNFVNDQPTFTASNPPTAFVSTGAHTVPGWVTKFNASGDAGGPDANEASQAVKQYTVSNVTNPALFTVLPAVSNSGVLTYTLSPLASGTTTFDVQVQDNGGTANGGIDTSAAQTFTLNVVKYDSSVTVTSSASPSAVTGQNVTLTATVRPKAPGTATPAGTVDFLIDGVTVASGISLTAGQATFQTTGLTVAGSPHSVTVNFHDNDLLFNDGTGSLTGGQSVVQARTSTTVSSSMSSTTFGQAVTFTATVVSLAPGSGVPDGSVTFLVDGVSQGAFSIDPFSGQATFSTSSLNVGTRVIKANYGGSPSYAVSGGTLPGGEVVTKAPTSTGLTASFNPSRVNEPITYTATVSSPGISIVPTGSVSFYIDGTFRTTGTLVGGQTTFSPGAAALPVGNHTVTGQYTGSGSFQISSGSVTQVVKAAGRTTSFVGITSSENPSIYSDTVTLTAAVTGALGTPTGAVTFYFDGNNQGTFALDGNGQYQFVTSTLTVANHAVRVAYYGDDTYAAASQSMNQIVNKIPTTTTLTASFNPSRVNEPITYTATVSSQGVNVVPTGTVSFYIDGTFRTTGTLVGGQTTFSPGAAALPLGNHTVTAQYTGTATIAISSNSLTQSVKAPGKTTSSITIFASEAPSFYGDSVTFTADVTGTAETPTGAVTFFVNGTNQGTFAVDGFGLSQFVVSTLAVGNSTIGATYWGDDTYALKSGSITQTVNKAVTTTGLSSSANPSVVLTPVTFTATVTTTVSGTPAGSVTFFVDGASQTTVNLSGGQATFVTSALAVGSHNVVAQYNGSATLAVSFGSLSPQQQVQNPGTSTTTTFVSSSLNPSLPSQSVTFTATVSDPNNGGTPSGWVRFMIDNVLRPYVALDGSGQATYTLASMTGGTHPVYAFYYGDLTYARSQSPLLTQTVTVTPPASLSASIAQVGTSYTITVLALTATGTVDTAYNGPVSFVPVSVPQNGSIQGGTTSAFSNGVAQFPGLAFSPAGKYEVEIIDQASGLTLFFTFFIGGRQS